MHELVFPAVKAAVTGEAFCWVLTPLFGQPGILESGFGEEAQLISL